jgi:hypothetical protein
MVIGIGIAAGVVAFLVILVYSSPSNDQEIIIFDDYPVGTAEPLENYTRTAVVELQRKVCDDEVDIFDINSIDEDNPESYSWFPQKITFQYLEPKENVIRQACSVRDDKIQYTHFMIRDGTPITVGNPNQLFQPIESGQQALEYLAYFPITHKSGDSRFIIPSEDQFDSITSTCTVEAEPSTKDIRVTKENDYYDIAINVYNRRTGEISHENWQVPMILNIDAHAESTSRIGQCPALA